MKIHQLPQGARFEYEGQEYVKTGPLFGTAADGRRRLIPRHAVLKPTGPGEAGGSGKETKSVAAAFEDFFRKCRSLVPDENQAELSAARDEFLKALRKGAAGQTW